ARTFAVRAPAVIGSEYLVLGTVDRGVWKVGLGGAGSTLDEMLEHVAQFKKVLKLEVEPGGWYPAGASKAGREPPQPLLRAAACGEDAPAQACSGMASASPARLGDPAAPRGRFHPLLPVPGIDGYGAWHPFTWDNHGSVQHGVTLVPAVPTWRQLFEALDD